MVKKLIRSTFLRYYKSLPVYNRHLCWCGHYNEYNPGEGPCILWKKLYKNLDPQDYCYGPPSVPSNPFDDHKEFKDF